MGFAAGYGPSQADADQKSVSIPSALMEADRSEPLPLAPALTPIFMSLREIAASQTRAKRNQHGQGKVRTLRA